MPTKEAKLIAEATELGTVEAGAGQSRFLIRIIEGDRWGSSGYYPAAVLKSDGPRVFTEGTQMYLNHPSMSDEYDQPERRVQDIVGVLASDAVYDEESKSLTAEATIFSQFAGMVQEIAPHIGVSIRAYVTAEYGEIEGQIGDVITSFVAAESVDIVTRAGAGGAILQAIESAVGKRPDTRSGKENKEAAMADTGIDMEKIEALSSAMTKLTEALTHKDEVDPIDLAAEVARKVGEAKLPHVMESAVFSAVKAGADVDKAIEAAKAQHDAIVAEVKESTKAPTKVAVGGSVSEVSEAQLNAALLGL